MNDEKLRIIGGLIIAVILVYPVFAFGMDLVNGTKAGKSGGENIQRSSSSANFQESVINRLPNTYAELGEFANKENPPQQHAQLQEAAQDKTSGAWQPVSSSSSGGSSMPVRRIPASFGFALDALPNVEPNTNNTYNNSPIKAAAGTASPIRYKVDIEVSQESEKANVKEGKKGSGQQGSSVVYRKE